MPLTPPPGLSTPTDAGSFQTGASTAPSVDTSVGASPSPAIQDPGTLEDENNIRNIVASARILAMKYPAAVPAVQQITSAVQDLQNAIMQTQQPAEMAAPPQ